MDIKTFLNEISNEIKYNPVKKGITDELKSHIEEIKQEYVENGIEENEAEEKAVKQMGNATDIGKKLNKIHRPKLDLKLLILIFILIGFGITISILKQSSTNNNYIINTIIYMAIGMILSICIYFVDYKKIKKYSNFIYLFATLLIILSTTEIGLTINSTHFINIFGITFRPITIALPLYIISFAGFISGYNKNNKLKICTNNKEIYLKKDIIKMIILGLLSIALMLYIPSVASAFMLSIVYFIIIFIKLVKEKNTKGLKILLGTLGTIIIIFTISTIRNPYRTYSIFKRIAISYKPEIDSSGRGYTGILQKDILENAKLIGEANTDIIKNENYIINNESNYTFIYLLGKTGIIIAGALVMVIILTSLKLILNAKNIKEEYGKLLTIGLGSLYILESIISVLMNINLGVKIDVDLPFVTYGGVYFIINMLCISIILAVYRRKDIVEYEEERIEENEKNT